MKNTNKIQSNPQRPLRGSMQNHGLLLSKVEKYLPMSSLYLNPITIEKPDVVNIS